MTEICIVREPSLSSSAIFVLLRVTLAFAPGEPRSPSLNGSGRRSLDLIHDAFADDLLILRDMVECLHQGLTGLAQLTDIQEVMTSRHQN